MSDKERIAAAIELLNRQKITHASLIGPEYPVLIEVERVLAILEARDVPAGDASTPTKET